MVTKKKISKTEKVAEVKEKVKKPVEPKEDLKAIAEKRDNLIGEIRGKIMTNELLKRGGSGVRSRYTQEIADWNPVIAEINELGLKLRYAPIGLGHLRK